MAAITRIWESDESTRNEHARPVTEGEDENDEDTDHFSDAEEAFGPLQGGDASAEDALAEDVGAHEDEDLGPEEDYLQLERVRTSTPDNVNLDNGPATPEAKSPLLSQSDSGSIPDDTPSLQGSLLSSPGESLFTRSTKDSVACGIRCSPNHSRDASKRDPLHPDRRLREEHLRLFLSPHSRQISFASQLSQVSSQGASEDRGDATSTLGRSAMDKAAQDNCSSFLGNWEAEFRTTDISRCVCADRCWYFERTGIGIRLPPDPQDHHWSRHQSY